MNKKVQFWGWPSKYKKSGLQIKRFQISGNHCRYRQILIMCMQLKLPTVVVEVVVVFATVVDMVMTELCLIHKMQ